MIIAHKKESYIMAGRMIPKSTKVKVQFFKGINFSDILVAVFALALVALALTTNLNMMPKLIICGVVGFITMILFISLEPGVRLYKQVGDLFKFMFGINTYKKQKKAGLQPSFHARDVGITDNLDYWQ